MCPTFQLGHILPLTLHICLTIRIQHLGTSLNWTTIILPHRSSCSPTQTTNPSITHQFLLSLTHPVRLQWTVWTTNTSTVRWSITSIAEVKICELVRTRGVSCPVFKTWFFISHVECGAAWSWNWRVMSLLLFVWLYKIIAQPAYQFWTHLSC